MNIYNYHMYLIVSIASLCLSINKQERLVPPDASRIYFLFTSSLRLLVLFPVTTRYQYTLGMRRTTGSYSLTFSKVLELFLLKGSSFYISIREELWFYPFFVHEIRKNKLSCFDHVIFHHLPTIVGHSLTLCRRFLVVFDLFLLSFGHCRPFSAFVGHFLLFPTFAGHLGSGLPLLLGETH